MRYTVTVTPNTNTLGIAQDKKIYIAPQFSILKAGPSKCAIFGCKRFFLILISFGMKDFDFASA
jgi:hypothetical protein